MIKLLFLSLLLFSYIILVSCSMYDGMKLKPHKISVQTSGNHEVVDKDNDEKDYDKNSYGITIKQEFIWRDR